MKKYLVVATVLVALVALFSFSASAAADVALDANVAYTADATGVSVDSIAVNLSGATAPETGYYTVLAYTGTDEAGADVDSPTAAGAEILYAAQEVSAITGFNIPAADLKGSLQVKFGGTGIDTAASDSAEFVFALVALNSEGKAIAYSPYRKGNSLEATGAASYVIFGAEVMTAAEAGLTGDAASDTDNEYAIRSFRTIIKL